MWLVKRSKAKIPWNTLVLQSNLDQNVLQCKMPNSCLYIMHITIAALSEKSNWEKTGLIRSFSFNTRSSQAVAMINEILWRKWVEHWWQLDGGRIIHTWDCWSSNGDSNYRGWGGWDYCCFSSKKHSFIILGVRFGHPTHCCILLHPAARDSKKLCILETHFLLVDIILLIFLVSSCTFTVPSVLHNF